MVVDFVLEDEGWQQLFTIIPAWICEYIAGIVPPSNVGFADSVAWNGNNDVDFSI